MPDRDDDSRSPDGPAEPGRKRRWGAEPATDGALALAEASQRAIRVVLIDDRTLVRGGLHMLLDDQPDIELIRGERDLEAVADEMRDQRPDVVVLDLTAPDHSAVGAVGALLAQLPLTRIVVLASERDVASAPPLLAAGAAAFVARESIERDLSPAIRAVARGERFISARIEPGLKSAPRPRGDNRLTTRETEVLRLIALGHTSVEIALALHLSPRTVETHRARIHKKLELATRAELVRYALRRGLLRA